MALRDKTLTHLKYGSNTLEINLCDLDTMKVTKTFTVPFADLTKASISNNHIIALSSNEYIVISSTNGAEVFKGEASSNSQVIGLDGELIGALYNSKSSSLQVITKKGVSKVDLSQYKYKTELHLKADKDKLYLLNKTQQDIALYEYSNDKFHLKKEFKLKDNSDITNNLIFFNPKNYKEFTIITGNNIFYLDLEVYIA
jgi:hypothetical protein